MELELIFKKIISSQLNLNFSILTNQIAFRWWILFLSQTLMFAKFYLNLSYLSFESYSHNDIKCINGTRCFFQLNGYLIALFLSDCKGSEQFDSKYVEYVKNTVLWHILHILSVCEFPISCYQTAIILFPLVSIRRRWSQSNGWFWK